MLVWTLAEEEEGRFIVAEDAPERVVRDVVLESGFVIKTETQI